MLKHAVIPAIAYEPVLAAGLFCLIILLSNVSRWQNVAKWGARRASSFAILDLRVAFVRIANVLDLVRWLVTYLLLSFLFIISLVATYLVVYANVSKGVAIKLV